LLATTENGVVAVCGDVFWKENYPQNPRDDAYASNIEDLAKSRKQVLALADWIVPGHAGIYKVEKGIFNSFKNRALNKKPKKVLEFCKNCKKPFINENDNCICRPWLCFRCCKCGIDCDRCSCSHKRSH
jgi:glyoxylase-like metal-dependent hydrolase (beta-lactamase superfamily II)